MMGDMMLADDDLDIHAKIVRMTQNFDDAADGVLAGFGEFENFHVHDHPVQIFRPGHLDRGYANAIGILRSRRQFHALRNLDPLVDPIVVRDDKRSAFAMPKFAHHSLVRASKDLDDLSIGPAAALDARDVNYDPVPMHGLLRRIARYVDVALQTFDGMIGNEE